VSKKGNHEIRAGCVKNEKGKVNNKTPTQPIECSPHEGKKKQAKKKTGLAG
jgi:hypothetical protein